MAVLATVEMFVAVHQRGQEHGAPHVSRLYTKVLCRVRLNPLISSCLLTSLLQWWHMFQSRCLYMSIDMEWDALHYP